MGVPIGLLGTGAENFSLTVLFADASLAAVPFVCTAALLYSPLSFALKSCNIFTGKVLPLSHILIMLSSFSFCSGGMPLNVSSKRAGMSSVIRFTAAE